MQLLDGPLLKWCSGYLDQRALPPRASATADVTLLDYVKTFAKISRPAEVCVVRALHRQVRSATLPDRAACIRQSTRLDRTPCL